VIELTPEETYPFKERLHYFGKKILFKNILVILINIGLPWVAQQHSMFILIGTSFL
jgi:hypothetical protein